MLVTTLKGYLGETNIPVKDFAELVECDPQYLSRILHGKALAGKWLAKEIYRATDGVVKLPTNPNAKTYKKQNENKNEEKPQT
jgi:hypothetical protein